MRDQAYLKEFDLSQDIRNLGYMYIIFFLLSLLIFNFVCKYYILLFKRSLSDYFLSNEQPARNYTSISILFLTRNRQSIRDLREISEVENGYYSMYLFSKLFIDLRSHFRKTKHIIRFLRWN